MWETVQPNERFFLGIHGSCVQLLPIAIVRSDSFPRGRRPLTIPSPHGTDQRQTIDRFSLFDAIRCGGHNKLGLSIGSVVADADNGILQGGIGKSGVDNGPILFEVSVGHGRKRRDDFLAFQNIHKGSNGRMFNRFMNVFQSQQRRWITQRCVSTIENSNFHILVGRDIVDYRDAVQGFPRRSFPTDEFIFQDPLSEGFAQDGRFVAVSPGILDHVCDFLGGPGCDTIDHAVGKSAVFQDPIGQVVSVHVLGKIHHDVFGDTSIVWNVITGHDGEWHTALLFSFVQCLDNQPKDRFRFLWVLNVVLDVGVVDIQLVLIVQEVSSLRDGDGDDFNVRAHELIVEGLMVMLVVGIDF
mmetsp:Transcript_1215/g.2183  ORF Transcript_1215/g.2183 Transcript_1215/m.2183 type:complete len:355 (-) Transcript_1215:724-1788(-)